MTHYTTAWSQYVVNICNFPDKTSCVFNGDIKDILSKHNLSDITTERDGQKSKSDCMNP